MAKFNRVAVWQAIDASGLVAVFHRPDPRSGIEAARALALGGARVTAYQADGPDALQVFSDLVAFCRAELPTLILGASAPVDAEMSVRFLELGADFIASPMMEKSMARSCNLRRAAYLPGYQNTDDILSAAELGMEFIQVQAGADRTSSFPQKSCGMRVLVRSEMEAVPERCEPETLQAWFQAGAAAVMPGPRFFDAGRDGQAQSAEVTARTALILESIRAARQDNLFLGIEHVGLYENGLVPALQVAQWYGQLFGFAVDDLPSCALVEGHGPGRIEVVKAAGPAGVHIAVRVSDLDAAIRFLHERGVELEAPVNLPAIRWAYLKQPDPLGNRVHLVWRGPF